MPTPLPPDLGGSSLWGRAVDVLATLGNVLRGRRARDVIELLDEYERALASPPRVFKLPEDPERELLMEIRRKKLKSQLVVEIAYSVLGVLGTVVVLILVSSMAWERIAG